MEPNAFLVMWCNEGLECIANYTEYNKSQVWAALNNKKCPVSFPNINHLILRARYNTQRHYEIYIINIEPSITEDDIRALFDTNPQLIVDKIRKNGRCVFSDRANPSKVKIT